MIRDRPGEVLLVEDNPGDADLIREALREVALPLVLRVAQDGVAALEELRRSDASRPDLILLDLNLPKQDGREVLGELKRDPALSAIPVVVLSSSEAERDLLQAYQLHANCFVTKPVDLTELLATVRAIAEFWFRHVKLPPRRS